jgi:hypothetical protein
MEASREWPDDDDNSPISLSPSSANALILSALSLKPAYHQVDDSAIVSK